ncbi:unnamed protein product [Strongylus vulgaris]|uniref:ZP domain-containing protein n=1 Tax=Strongylus vulgaris TaxID=40348 RepID=A0A3P7IW37_STRVU|nr:unnamed protein product [Strongylus vulgaris]
MQPYQLPSDEILSFYHLYLDKRSCFRLVDCEDSLIGLTFKTKKPFSGRVYVHEMAGDEKCSKAFVDNRNQSRGSNHLFSKKDNLRISMRFKNGDCTMQRQKISGQIQGLISSLVVVVSFHGTFVTKADRAYKCICFFRSQKTLTNSIGKGITFSRIGAVGEKIYHVWQCDSPTTRFLVHSCSVSDGLGERIDLIDVDGCAIDPAIQPDVLYENDSKAIVEVYGYKFSDATVLNYECVLEICRSSLECEELTPPKCAKSHPEDIFPTESLRRSRAIGNKLSLLSFWKRKRFTSAHDLTYKRGQIEVAATLTMENSLDASALRARNDLPTPDYQQVPVFLQNN